jgi:YD repeat-containing protein
MLPASAQAEPHTGIALRAWYWHHLNFLALVPSFYFEQCGESDPDIWEWPQNYGSQGLVTAVVMGDTRISLEYDGRGRLIRYDSPGYVTATCAYDEASNLILWTRNVRLGDDRLDTCSDGIFLRSIQRFLYPPPSSDSLGKSAHLALTGAGSSGTRIAMRDTCSGVGVETMGPGPETGIRGSGARRMAR